MDRTKKCAGCRKHICDGCAISWAGPKRESAGRRVLPEEFVIDAGETGYGIAFDIGTTTVAGLLFDLESGRLMQAASRVNPQTTYGRDVISRISYVMETKEHLNFLHDLIVGCLNEIIGELSEGAVCKKIVVAGNPLMCCLLMGISPAELGHAPFTPPLQGGKRLRGEALGLYAGAGCEVVILPGIDGHVGADMAAAYGYVRHLASGTNLLVIDLGTNGEMIALGEKGGYACSAAAGPALEGAAVVQGMRGGPGAIEGVRIEEDDLQIQVIGEAVPTGICGSGLVDALAVLLEIGVMDETGYLLSEQEARKKGIAETWLRRLTVQEGQHTFCLSKEGAGVFITAADIRQLQLAKSAVRAGCEVLLDRLGIEAGELEAVYLSGAFGNYMKTESALRIGLLPNAMPERISSVGNGAGIGAGMALLSKGFAAELEREVKRLIHVELAQEPYFEEKFIGYINFGK